MGFKPHWDWDLVTGNGKIWEWDLRITEERFENKMNWEMGLGFPPSGPSVKGVGEHTIKTEYKQ